MATTTPNYGWSVPESTDFVKDGATAIELLGDSIDASFVDLLGGTTGQVLTKASGTDLDFSFTTPSAGGGMTLLQTVTLAGNSVTTSSLSGAFKSLQCYFFGLQVIGVNSGIRLRVNSNTGSNYGNAFLSDSNTTYTVTTETSMRIVDFVPVPTGNISGMITLPLYANSSISLKHAFVTQTNDVARTMILNGFIKETAAITTLTFATLSAASFAGTVQIFGVN